MRCVARDYNKGGVIISIDFDGLVTNLDNGCASEHSYLGVVTELLSQLVAVRAFTRKFSRAKMRCNLPKDNIVLCFFMPMKWQKTAFVNSNKSLLEHTGKFAIFNLKIEINN